jgi:hypothetical protein
MDENPRQGGSGWTAGKVLGVIVGLIGMVGFGVCSLCGMVFIGSQYSDGSVWFLTILGIVLTMLSLWLVIAMFRKARNERDRNLP